MRNVIVGILVGLIAWDVVTTYYGTLSIFYSGHEEGVIARIIDSEGFAHIVSLIFAIALIAFILSHRIIFDAENKITIGILLVAFVYDFATSFYGTGEAVNMAYDNIPQMFIIILLAVMTTASPLLITHVVDQD